MAELSCGTRTPTNPSRLYRSVNASAKTRLSGSTSRRVACSGPRTLRSGRHIVSSGGAVLDHGHSLPNVVVHADDPIQAIQVRLDVGKQDHLREPIRQAAEKVHNRHLPLLVERAKDLVEQ